MSSRRPVKGLALSAACAGALGISASCTFPEFVFAPEPLGTTDAAPDDEPSWGVDSPAEVPSTTVRVDAGAPPQKDSAQSGREATATPVPTDARGGPANGAAFTDDFEEGHDGLWRREKLGSWSVVSSGGNRVYEQPFITTYPTLTAADTVDWRDQTVEAKVKITKFGGTSDANFVAVYGRYLNTNNTYAIALRADGNVSLRKRLSGNASWLASTSTSISVGVWYTLRLELAGNRLRGWLDGREVLEAFDSSLEAGTVAVGTTSAAAQFDDVHVVAP